MRARLPRRARFALLGWGMGLQRSHPGCPMPPRLERLLQTARRPNTPVTAITPITGNHQTAHRHPNPRKPNHLAHRPRQRSATPNGMRRASGKDGREPPSAVSEPLFGGEPPHRLCQDEIRRAKGPKSGPQHQSCAAPRPQALSLSSASCAVASACAARIAS